jgi:hypothetical protein
MFAATASWQRRHHTVDVQGAHDFRKLFGDKSAVTVRIKLDERGMYELQQRVVRDGVRRCFCTAIAEGIGERETDRRRTGREGESQSGRERGHSPFTNDNIPRGCTRPIRSMSQMSNKTVRTATTTSDWRSRW